MLAYLRYNYNNRIAPRISRQPAGHNFVRSSFLGLITRTRCTCLPTLLAVPVSGNPEVSAEEPQEAVPKLSDSARQEAARDALLSWIGHLMAGMEWQQRYRDRFYSAASGYVDGMTEFYRLCASVIPIGSRILEIGSGPSNPTSRFLQTLGHVTGVDVDPEVRTNDALGAALVMSDETYPVPNDSFDACVSDYVIEHLSDPLRHLQEVRRVLKPNGAYVFRTPNSLHYVTIASRLTPHWFHKLVANRLRNLPPGTHDPYPTRYRLNSRSRIRLTAACAHLDVETLRLIEKDPWYGRSSRALFLCFMLYERLVNSHDVFAPFRVNLLGILRKREE